MTKRERAQVVELLRCAADLALTTYDAGIGEACMRRGYYSALKKPWSTCVAARIDARNYEQVLAGIIPLSSYWEDCLEAAARVEQGEWP